MLLFSSLVCAGMTPREIYTRKAPGVVLIVASADGSSSSSAGTGSIIRRDGLVITNSHVIYNPATKAPYSVVHVFLKPAKVAGDMNRDLSRHFSAKVVAHDRSLDLALVQIQNPPKNMTIIKLGDPADIGPGDETIAIGHPEQGGLWTITKGVIGAEFVNFKGISGKDVFQMDTSLNRGNSGGPLFDVRGLQIGVNTAIARRGEGGIAITGVNFAIKSHVVKSWTAKHRVRLSFGSDRPERDSQPDQIHKKPRTRHRPIERQGNTYKDPEGRGTLTLEEGYGEYRNENTDEQREQVARSGSVKKLPPQRANKNNAHQKRPDRFTKRYQTPRRPFSYRALFTAVDKVRGRAQDAFDDLKNEARKRR
jgi:hypothetical protein